MIALVGLSREKNKDSYIVAEYLQKRGYSIIPINPFADEILGEKCYPDLNRLPVGLKARLDIVDIFRPSNEVLPIIDEVIKIKFKYDTVKVVWMQLGIFNEEAAEKAEAVGLTVVMDRCIMEEHKRLMPKD